MDEETRNEIKEKLEGVVGAYMERQLYFLKTANWDLAQRDEGGAILKSIEAYLKPINDVGQVFLGEDYTPFERHTIFHKLELRYNGGREQDVQG